MVNTESTLRKGWFFCISIFLFSQIVWAGRWGSRGRYRTCHWSRCSCCRAWCRIFLRKSFIINIFIVLIRVQRYNFITKFLKNSLWKSQNSYCFKAFYHKIPCFSLFAITLFPFRYTFLISLFIRFQKKDVLLPLNSWKTGFWLYKNIIKEAKDFCYIL